MTVTDIIALLGGFVGVVGVVVSALTARNGATKAELESLRDTIKGLQDENERLRRRLGEVETAASAKDRRIEELQREIVELQSKVNRRKAI